MVRPSHRREMAKKAVETKGVSIELACRAFKISESCYRYEKKLNEVVDVNYPDRWATIMLAGGDRE